MRRRGLVVACASAALVVSAAAVLRIATTSPGDTSLVERMLLTLIATALLLVALLALPRAEAAAWAAATLAAGLGSIEVVGAVRGLEPVVSSAAWQVLVPVAALALAISALTGAAYAAREWRTVGAIARAWVFIVEAGSVATVAASVWATASAGSAVEVGQLSPLRIATRIGLATIVGAFLVGVARDLGPRARRAFERWRRSDAPAGGRLWSFAAALADEVLPGRVADRRAAAETERARLAADLHALVLPDLRRAAATADAAGLPREAQLDLLRALEDVEQLMHQRQSVVLEQFGLVAALEWLADRTEERSPIRVELELDGDVPDRPGAIDPAVARAAFRIALLALDNVVRHAGATTATIRLAAGPGDLRLSVTDDGTGSSDREGMGGRGIADMRSAAAASGGTISVDLERGGRVAVAWLVSRAAANHAIATARAADRSSAQSR